MMVSILFRKPCQPGSLIIYLHGGWCLRTPSFMSIVTLYGTQARQGLARGGGKNSGPKGAVGPLNERASIPRESDLSQPLGGSRFAA